MPLYVRQLKLGPMENFVYLVGAEGARETALIDPAWDVEAALAAAEEDGRAVTHALVSHHHFDRHDRHARRQTFPIALPCDEMRGNAGGREHAKKTF